MGTWGTGIGENDSFSDIYDDYFDLYNSGLSEPEITRKLTVMHQETIDLPEDSNNFWFALAKAQWECKALDRKVLLKVKEIVDSGRDLTIWKELDASEEDLKERKTVLGEFLTTISVERSEPRPREKTEKKLSDLGAKTEIPSPLKRLLILGSGVALSAYFILWPLWQAQHHATDIIFNVKLGAFSLIFLTFGAGWAIAPAKTTAILKLDKNDLKLKDILILGGIAILFGGAMIWLNLYFSSLGYK